jgi:Tol biopolymer transport system component
MRYDRESRQFVTFLGGISAEGLDFSRDGEWVVYGSFPDHTLWRSRANGADRLQLTSPEMRVSLPRWSPDGKWIAFAGSRAGGVWKIYRVPAEGGSSEVLVDSYDGANDPNWSPDGKRLVFGKSFPLKDDEPVYVLDLQTREVSKLPGSEGTYSPRWSRDGRFILAMTRDSRKLLLLDLTTQQWKTLSEGRLHSYPTWSQDSQYIYFSSPFETNTPFYRVRIRDSLLEKVTDAKVAKNLAAGVFGMWTGLDPDDSPMILRDTSLQEIYALDWQLP